MAVKALKPYKGEVKDNVERFHGMQLLYIGWDDHKMFVAPFAFVFPPNMRFGDICEKVLPGAFGYHPDWKKVDMSKAQWLKSSQPWTPDMTKTLAELGLKHKDALRFITPGLTGLKGSSY
jgi:phenol hydroxylase P4 protein